MDKEIPTVPSTTTVSDLYNRIVTGDPVLSRRQGTLILDKDSYLVGIMTRGDILKTLRNDPSGSVTVLEAAETNLIVAYADESLQDAIARMLKNNIGRLPVVDRQDARKVIGYLGRSGILTARARFYDEEETRAQGPIVPFRSEKN